MQSVSNNLHSKRYAGFQIQTFRDVLVICGKALDELVIVADGVQQYFTIDFKNEKFVTNFSPLSPTRVSQEFCISVVYAVRKFFKNHHKFIVDMQTNRGLLTPDDIAAAIKHVDAIIDLFTNYGVTIPYNIIDQQNEINEYGNASLINKVFTVNSMYSELLDISGEVDLTDEEHEMVMRHPFVNTKKE